MSTLTQFLSGKLKSQDFTSSGTFTVPAGVTTVWVTMTGGGGSGAALRSFTPAAGGAAGAYCIKRAVTVTPGASITVTIGAGGAGIPMYSNGDFQGNQGGTTSFGSVSVSGGYGGQFRSSVAMPTPGGANGGYLSNNVQIGATSAGGVPGRVGLDANNGFRAGGGGGGLFGNGTDGGYMTPSASAAANTGAGTGGAVADTNSSGMGTGNGGSGRCIVEWVE